MVIYLQWFIPIATRFANNLETFNEVTLLLLTYLAWCFSDFVSQPETRNDLGFWFIGISLGNICVHISIMLFDSLKKIIQRCKGRQARKKAIKLA